MNVRAWTVPLLAGLSLAALLAAPSLWNRLPFNRPATVHGGEQEQPVAAAIQDFDASELSVVLPPDAIPALDHPVTVSAREADAELEDDDLVIGVEVKGKARAYPVRVLSAHEIVNDTVRGKPLAVTW